MLLQNNLEFEFVAPPEEVPERGPGLKAPFAEQLLAFHEFGKKTVLAETAAATPGGKTCPVPTYINEFWTAKQRAASRLHEISYRACFKPQLPRFFIERLTCPGEVVYDPFMGRGTTLLEAALLEGELIQLERIGRMDVGEADCMELVDRKTARLFSVCARLGAVASHADGHTEERLGGAGP